MLPIRHGVGVQTDLRAIARYIAQDSPRAALAFLNRIRQRIEQIPGAPLAGRMVPEWERPDVREVFVASYRIIYQVREADIVVLTVFEGHRLLPLDEPQEP